MFLLIVAIVAALANLVIGPLAAFYLASDSPSDRAYIETSAKMWTYLIAFSIALTMAERAGAF